MTGEPAFEPVINIRGQRVWLGPPRREHVPLYLRWFNDFEVTRTLALSLVVMAPEQEEAWYESLPDRPYDALFMIYEASTGRPIGSAGLHGIDHFQGTAEFGIAIGEKDCWGKGYGTEVTRLMLEYGFVGLGLHNIMLRAYQFNERGIRAYRRAGFRECGRWRQANRLGDRFYDVVLMDCLATEFEPRVLAPLVERAATSRSTVDASVTESHPPLPDRQHGDRGRSGVQS